MISKLITDLSEEHVVIERLLASLLHVAAQAAEGDTYTKPLLTRHLELFRRLLDTVHHGREEEILFEALRAAGMPTEHGPIAVMLVEHDLGRKHIATLDQVASSSGGLRGAELETLKTAAATFAQLLTAHIAKEENVLYPVARRHLGELGLRQVDEADATWQQRKSATRDRLIEEASQLAAVNLESRPRPAA